MSDNSVLKSAFNSLFKHKVQRPTPLELFVDEAQ